LAETDALELNADCPLIRAFIAVEIDPQVIGRISSAIDQLRSQIFGVRWAAAENFHLTLRFLGDVEEARIDAIGAALEDHLHLFPRFSINAKGLGVFPDMRRPRVLWVGLAASELASLVSELQSTLERFGFAAETRSFTPHLTIGRWRQIDRAPKSLGPSLESWKDYPFGATNVDEVILFQSLLNSKGAVHTRLRTVTLKNKQSNDRRQ
jgi:RNA 2',3'-cyclic 3'-phosphodiesterase